MVLFFPMAALFSTMLLLVRMAKDNELTVLRTSGIQTFRIILPIYSWVSLSVIYLIYLMKSLFLYLIKQQTN